MVQLAHPASIALGQVIVHRYHVHTLAFQGIQIHRQCGYQGFTFTGFHFGDVALVEHHAANQLHIKVAHTQHAAAGLAHQRKGIGQDVVQRGLLFASQALFEHGRLLLQRGLVHIFIGWC